MDWTEPQDDKGNTKNEVIRCWLIVRRWEKYTSRWALELDVALLKS